MGTRTDQAEPTVAFFRDVLGLPAENPGPDFWVLKAADGAKVEVFGPQHPHNRHFTTGPVVGFLVEDVYAAAEELRAAASRSNTDRRGARRTGTPGCISAHRTGTRTNSPRTPVSCGTDRLRC